MVALNPEAAGLVSDGSFEAAEANRMQSMNPEATGS